MEQIQLNIIPFKPVVTKGAFAFYGEKQKGFTSINWDKLFEQFPEGREAKLQFYYTDFQAPGEGAITKEVEFYNAINFANHYFTHLIFNYFKNITGAVVFPNYVDDVEVWFEDKSEQNSKYKLYNKFTLKVQYNCVVQKSFEIMVAYNGTSKVLHSSIAQLADFDTTQYNLVNCNGSIYKYDNMPDDLKQDQTTLFPVLSNTLKKTFDIEEEFKKENRFPIYLGFLENFCTLHRAC